MLRLQAFGLKILWVHPLFANYILTLNHPLKDPKMMFLLNVHGLAVFSLKNLDSANHLIARTANDSPIISNVGFGPTKPDLSPDSEMEGIHLSSSHVSGFHGDTVFPDLSVQESVSRDGYNESKIQPNDCQTLELEKENCIGNNEISSENEKAVDASDSKDNGSECREAKDKTPKPLVSLKMAFSPEHAEETSSSSVKIPVKSGSIVDEKEYHHDAQISLLCQNGSKEIEDAVPEERKIISEEQNNCVNPSRQVMMLESYVLQLLCVQKVLKEASAQDAMKKTR
ncbi:hypothetical protein L1049_013358 [Liquidambar formosana]|uniref:Uncharacterized protein n=1 Tax=Liquidambar formosana TaxID=63359 RepID=A0AAP0RLD0_LIQFO